MRSLPDKAPSQQVTVAREILFALRDRLQHIRQKLSAPDVRQLAASALTYVNFMVRGWTPGDPGPA